MPRSPSPLRYPGGKASIVPMVSAVINANSLNGCNYAEPYAGGGGLALQLMFYQYVHDIHLNDLDRSIWAFWHSILNHTDRFIDKILTTEITMEEWQRQRNIQAHKETADSFDLGFSSFFLNRTNRSGIILKAGVIGGFKQEGKYRLNCRFNKEGLIQRIKRIADYKHRIHLYNMDAVDFLQEIDTVLPAKSFFYIDPPYYEKGATLYTNFYKPEDHQQVADTVLKLKHPWLLTYDNVPEIRELYANCQQQTFSLNYSVAEKRLGEELFITSKGLITPTQLNFYKVS